jgi:hypothetical protein
MESETSKVVSRVNFHYEARASPPRLPVWVDPGSTFFPSNRLSTIILFIYNYHSFTIIIFIYIIYHPSNLNSQEQSWPKYPHAHR